MDVKGHAQMKHDVVDLRGEKELNSASTEDDSAFDKPHFIELAEQPGMEVVAHSNLEVVSPRHGLSSTRTWEKTSALPETVARVSPPAVSPWGGSNPGYPTPSEYATPYTTYSSTSPDYDYLDRSGRDRGPPVPSKDGIFRHDTICGLRRQLFWIIIAVGVFVMIAAVAVGVGLGVALHKSDTSGSSNSDSIPALPSPTASASTNGTAIKCQTNNNTLYISHATGRQDRQFLLSCGVDYNSADGAHDIANEPADSMNDCIDRCAATNDCIAVGFGNFSGEQLCWLKSKLGKANLSYSWYFAYEDPHATVTPAAAM